MCCDSGDRTPKRYRRQQEPVFLMRQPHQTSTSSRRPLQWSCGRSRSVMAHQSQSTTSSGHSEMIRILCRYMAPLFDALIGIFIAYCYSLSVLTCMGERINMRGNAQVDHINESFNEWIFRVLLQMYISIQTVTYSIRLLLFSCHIPEISLNKWIPV